MKRVQMFLAGAFRAVGALYAQSSDAEWQAEVAKLKGTIQTNPAQAAEEAEHLIKGKNKKNVELLVAIGNAYLDADKLPEAQEYATLARKANGKSALASDLQFQVGRLYYGAGTQPDSLTITVEERKQALMSADSVFHAIAEAAPDNYLGNFWRARANSALDPETTQGLAKPFYEEVAALLESKNDPHYNSALVECYSYLGYYYLLAIENPALKAEAKANKDKSIEYWNKILAIDPANATAKRALDGIK